MGKNTMVLRALLAILAENRHAMLLLLLASAAMA